MRSPGPGGRDVNTPTHVLMGMAAFGSPKAPRLTVAAALGGLLPDVPAILMVLWASRVEGYGPGMIFGTLYFSPSWQALLAPWHSVPLWALVLAAGFHLRSPPTKAFAGSGLPHQACDLPAPPAQGVRRLGAAPPALRLPGPRRRPAPPLLAAQRLALPQPGLLLGPPPLRPPLRALRGRAHARAPRLPRVAAPLALAAGCPRAGGARLRGPAGRVPGHVLTPAPVRTSRNSAATRTTLTRAAPARVASVPGAPA